MRGIYRVIKHAAFLACIGLLAASPPSPAWGQDTIPIQASIHSPMVSFAAKRLELALRGVGYFRESGFTISLSVEAGESQSFSIHRDDHLIKITGGDERGLMYGGLRLAEEVDLGEPLESVPDETRTAFVPVRAFKFNLPLPGCLYLDQYYLTHNKWFWSLDYWQELVDTLAQDNYTTIEFYSAEPWSQMVSLPKYPEASTLTAEEMRQHVDFFRTLFRMAKDRGLDTFLITWNIHLSPSFAQAHQLPLTNVDSPLVRDYLRESVRAVLSTYPDLTGLGTTQGERMGVIPTDQRASWVADVYFGGIQESGRHQVPFILRYWGGTAEATEKAVAAYEEGPVYLDIKYNGEHGYASPMYHVRDSSWLSQTHHYKLLWQLRNDDLYIFRWGEPEFVREVMQNVRAAGTAGYTYGSEIDIPGTDDFDVPAAAAHRSWKYEFQKQWFTLALWGRLGYDPSLPESIWRGYFRLHYGPAGDALYDSTVAASRLAPLITSFHWNYMDGDWYVEGSIGSWNTASEQPRINYRRDEVYHSILDWVFNNTIDSGYQNFLQYAAQVLAQAKPAEAIRSPLDVAQEAESDGRTALLAASIPDPGGSYSAEFRAAQSDDEAYGHLGLYYAEKIRGAADLTLFLFSGQQEYKAKAAEHLQRAFEQWKELVAITASHYAPRDIWMFGRFDWGMYSRDVQADIQMASATEAFPEGSQVWQVAAKGESNRQNVSVQTYGPFAAAGFHSWFLYAGSLMSWHHVETVAGRSSTYVWQQDLKPKTEREWVLELPAAGAGTVTIDGKPIKPVVSTIEAGIIPPVQGYEVYPLGTGGTVNAELKAGVVPQVTAIAESSAVRIEIPASDATSVESPLIKTASGTLRAPAWAVPSYMTFAALETPASRPPGQGAGLPPAIPLDLLSTKVNKAGTASFQVRLIEQGFYRVSCQVRAPQNEAPTALFSVDNFNVRDDRLSGRPSADWQWVTSSNGIPLGPGIHTLTIYVRIPNEQIKAVALETAN